MICHGPAITADSRYGTSPGALSGARTFQSAATLEPSTIWRHSLILRLSHAEADRKVRAPITVGAAVRKISDTHPCQFRHSGHSRAARPIRIWLDSGGRGCIIYA